MKKKVLSFLAMFIVILSSIGFACEPNDPGCIEKTTAFGDVIVGGFYTNGTPTFGGFAQGEGKLCGDAEGKLKATFDSSLTGTNNSSATSDGVFSSKAILEFKAGATFDEGKAKITSSGSVDEGSISSVTEGNYSFGTSVQTAGVSLNEKTISTTSGGELNLNNSLTAEGTTGSSINTTIFTAGAFANNITSSGDGAYANNQIEAGIKKEFTIGPSIAIGSAIGGGDAAISCPSGAVGTNGVTTSGVTFTPSAGGLVIKSTSSASEKAFTR